MDRRGKSILLAAPYLFGYKVRQVQFITNFSEDSVLQNRNNRPYSIPGNKI
jgi:hypothetical protein